MMPMNKEIQYLLSTIREIREDHLLYDVHAHPFNVAFPCPKYKKDSEMEGLFCAGNSAYKPPNFSEAGLDDDDTLIGPEHNPALRRKFFALKSRGVYAHTGPRVMHDHMELASIDRVLLLPVLGTEEHGDTQMDLLGSMFSGHDEFACGYCVPNKVQEEDIVDAIGAAKKRFRVKAIKVHPNITGIDPATDKGRERIHRILEGSSVHALPVLVHGGLSLEFADGKASRYASPENLERINWDTTDEPVILAHAGMFGFDDKSIKSVILPILGGMLRKYENLVVDISGLSAISTSMVLQNVSTDRILFGSDALYFPQWIMVLRLIKLLRDLDHDFTKRFIAVMHENPKRCIFQS